MISQFPPKNYPNIQNIVCKYCIIPYMVIPNTVILTKLLNPNPNPLPLKQTIIQLSLYPLSLPKIIPKTLLHKHS